MGKRKTFLAVLFTLFFVNLITINHAVGYIGSIPHTGDFNTDMKIRDAQREQHYYDTMMSLGADSEDEGKETEKINTNQQVKKPTKTNEEICKSSIGDNSKYNSELKKCECEDGHKLYKNKCVDYIEYGEKYCKETAGINYRYNPDEDNCIANEDYCKKILGDNSKYLINEDECICEAGFALSENNCVAEEQPKVEQPNVEKKSFSIKEKLTNFFNKIKFW